MARVAVWDLPTRAFHWLLVVGVAVAYATGGEDRWFVVHGLAGYSIAALLAFRLVWGVIGSPHSRFNDFVYGWRALRAYADRLVRLEPPRFVGHNPLGGWMVVAMIVTLLASIATGLVAGEPGEAAGPLLGVLVPASAGEPLIEVHEVLGNLIVGLALIHVVAVLLDRALTGENLIASMAHGKKTVPDALAREERPLVGSGVALTVALAIGLALAVAVQQTDFAAQAALGEAHDEEHD